jgi:hypothetical protein
MKTATEWNVYYNYEYVEARAKHNNESAWKIAWEKTIKTIRQEMREACAAENKRMCIGCAFLKGVQKTILAVGKEE